MKKLTLITVIILTANLLFAQFNKIDTSFYSEALGEEKMVDVYFPPGYDENPDLYYPVIYYLHYWTGDQNTISEMLNWTQSLINDSIIDPVIMICADNSPEPFDGTMYTNSILWGDYENYMTNDLINWIESSFRAMPSRDYRALLGHSMGGYGAFRYGALHKDKFRVLAATAAPFLNLTDSCLSYTRTKIIQQNQPGPPYFYDFYNTGSTTKAMFLFCGAFAPNFNTPQTYINPQIVEFAMDDYGNYIDTVADKLKENSIDHLIHLLSPADSVGILYGCGTADISAIEPHIAFKDTLDLLGLPYEYYAHTGGHIMPNGFKERALIFIDSLLMPPTIPSNSCLPEGITFTTQVEIDNFQTNHPNCTEIEGDVIIEGNNITNLNGLIVLTAFGGDLDIRNNDSLISLTGLENVIFVGGDLIILGNDALISLTGLENATSVGGGLWIVYNPVLTSLTGLENVASVGGGLGIDSNDALVNLTGLNNVTSIGEDLTIGGNNILTSLTGLENLTSIEGNLHIGYYDYVVYIGNPLLTSLAGLENVASIGGDLHIMSNDALISLTGLENITSIVGNLRIILNNTLINLSGLENVASIGGGSSIIDDNDALISLTGLENLTAVEGSLIIGIQYGNSSLISLTGLENMASVGGNLTIVGNDALTSLTGLENVAFVGGGLWISGTYALTSLTGLENVTSVGGSLQISGSYALTSLTGLENVTSIGGDLVIGGNAALISLTELENVDSVVGDLKIIGNNTLISLTGLNNISSIGGDLSIFNNASLSTCEVQSVCDYLASPNGNIYINNNATGCNSQAEVEAACEAHCLPEGITFTSQVQIDDFQTNYPNCIEIEGDVMISGNDITNLNGLNVLTAIWGDLSIGDNSNGNPVLTNLMGLINLDSIGGSLNIISNGVITNLTGLDSSLTSIGGGIWIENNAALISLTGLDNIDTAYINELNIVYNDSLSTCNVQSVCDYLASPNAVIEIHDNAPGCNSQQEVEDACWTKIDKLADVGNEIQIFPNPAKNKLFISAKNGVIIKEINIYNQIGQRVLCKKGKTNTVDVSMLRQGMYIIEIEINNGRVRSKLMIE